MQFEFRPISVVKCYQFVVCSLVRPAHLDELVNYILQTPADEENEKIKYK